MAYMGKEFKRSGDTYAAATAAKSLQSCPTLCDPIDGSPPGSAVPGILQAKILEWVAISFSRRYIYVYIYICICVCIYIYIYIYNRFYI